MGTATDLSASDRRVCRSWRERLLVNADFNPQLARLAAHDLRFDVHGLIELRERGCPPELAIRILAPLEEEPPR